MPSDTPPPAAPVRLLRRIALDLARVSLGGDLHERAARLGLALPLSDPRARRIADIARVGVLFVHIPKCAGMAVCDALYDTQLKHGTIRWYRAAVPQLAGLPSFAVVRDPVDRFVSAYRYAAAGGSADNRVAAAFRDRYRRFRCLDDAIDHVADARSLYAVDHVFRPQAWYVTDAAGRIAVDRLFRVHDPLLARHVRDHGGRPLVPVNRSHGPRPAVTPAQVARIRALYPADLALHAAAARPCAPAPLRALQPA